MKDVDEPAWVENLKQSFEEMNQHFRVNEVDWVPLELFLTGVDEDKRREFCFLGHDGPGDESIRMYKHCDTRGDLSLDADGNAYNYVWDEEDSDSVGEYEPISRDEALRLVSAADYGPLMFPDELPGPRYPDTAAPLSEE